MAISKSEVVTQDPRIVAEVKRCEIFIDGYLKRFKGGRITVDTKMLGIKHLPMEEQNLILASLELLYSAPGLGWNVSTSINEHTYSGEWIRFA